MTITEQEKMALALAAMAAAEGQPAVDKLLLETAVEQYAADLEQDEQPDYKWGGAGNWPAVAPRICRECDHVCQKYGEPAYAELCQRAIDARETAEEKAAR